MNFVVCVHDNSGKKFVQYGGLLVHTTSRILISFFWGEKICMSYHKIYEIIWRIPSRIPQQKTFLGGDVWNKSILMSFSIPVVPDTRYRKPRCENSSTPASIIPIVYPTVARRWKTSLLHDASKTSLTLASSTHATSKAGSDSTPYHRHPITPGNHRCRRKKIGTHPSIECGHPNSRSNVARPTASPFII